MRAGVVGQDAHVGVGTLGEFDEVGELFSHRLVGGVRLAPQHRLVEDRHDLRRVFAAEQLPLPLQPQLHQPVDLFRVVLGRAQHRHGMRVALGLQQAG